VVLRAGLELVRRRAGRGTDAARGQRIEQSAIGPQHTDVRPEELVRGADQVIDAQRAHVDRTMRRQVHRIDPHARAGGVSSLGDAPHVVHRAERVRGIPHGDEPSTLAEQPLESIEIESPLLDRDGNAPNDDAPLFEIEPRADIGVVIEIAHDDLVPRAQRTRDGVTEGVRERRHVRPEDDLVRRRATEERRAQQPGARHQRVRALAGEERAVHVGVGPREIVAHRLLDLARHLGAGGIVEEGDRARTYT